MPQINHNFVSPVADQANPGEVGPDEWNDTHAFTMASGFVLGRTSAGPGAVEELSPATLSTVLDTFFLTQAEADLLYAPLGSGGTGDVVGPASAVADRIATFNGTTGKLIKDGGKLISELALATDLAGYQPLDADLTAIAGLATATYGRSLLTLADATALAGQVDSFFLTPAEGNAAYQPLDGDLTAIANLATTGLVTRTAANTMAARTITATATQITVTNGDGVAGNPALSFPADVVIPTVLTVPNTGLHLLDTNASHDLIIKPGSDLTADRTFTLVTGDANRTLTMTGDATTNQDVSTAGTPQFVGLDIGGTTQTLSSPGAGNLSIEGNVIYRAGGTDVPVADGGTGVSALTAFAVLCGGTTSTAAIQALASLGTSGQVLTSNGAGALPSFQAAGGGAFTSVNIQAFTANGTYTPTSGMKYCIVISTGGGGGGGASDVTNATNNIGVGGGGGAGGTCIEFFSAATIGASQSVTIGAAGTAGAASGGGNGGAGGNTTFGSLHTATGGSGGTGSGDSGSVASNTAGGAGGVPTGGTINITGAAGGKGSGVKTGSTSIGIGGDGGASFWGGGGVGGRDMRNATDITNTQGTAGVAYGSGGGGTAADDTAGLAGMAGMSGVCMVIEFI